MAVGKLTYTIEVSRFINILYPIWFVQCIIGCKNFYMPKWAYKLEAVK